MKEYPKISIVTPNYNMAEYLEETIKSVLSQGYPNLEYIIIDGGSTDGSIDIIKKHAKHIFYWVSEKDNGLYHAISKGFSKSTGEIMGWINSDDVLLDNSLFTIANAFSKTKIRWIQGLNTVIDFKGSIISCVRPYNTSKFNFLCGAHLNGNTIKNFGTVQQESTYWRRSLWESAGGLNLTYKIAADFVLWTTFFRYNQMALLNSPIGAFRLREGQLSEINILRYIEETKRCISEEKKLLSLLDKAILYIFKFKITSFQHISELKGRIQKKLHFLVREFRSKVHG